MNETPRCDYIPMWSSPEHRCLNDAAFKVFRSHGAGISPVYKNRCVAHATGAFGPAIAAYRDPEAEEWRPTDGPGVFRQSASRRLVVKAPKSAIYPLYHDAFQRMRQLLAAMDPIATPSQP